MNTGHSLSHGTYAVSKCTAAFEIRLIRVSSRSRRFQIIGIITITIISLTALGVVSGNAVKSSIRRINPGNQMTIITETMHPTGLLTATEYDEFFIKITSDGYVQVARASEPMNYFLSSNVGPNVFRDTRYVGVKTIAYTGLWMFCSNDGKNLFCKSGRNISVEKENRVFSKPPLYMYVST